MSWQCIFRRVELLTRFYAQGCARFQPDYFLRATAIRFWLIRTPRPASVILIPTTSFLWLPSLMVSASMALPIAASLLGDCVRAQYHESCGTQMRPAGEKAPLKSLHTTAAW